MTPEMTNIYDQNIDHELAKKFLLDKAQKSKYSKSTWEYLKKDDPRFFKENRKHLKLLCTLFDMIDYREIWNLGFSFPRRYGKSYTISKAVAIAMGRRPEGSIMRNSYAAAKAEDYSRDTQAFISTGFFKKIFPTILQYQETYRKKGIKIGKVKTKNKGIQERNDLIYKNKDKTLKEIRHILANKNMFLDDGHIAKIISLEKQKRKEV